MSIYQIVFVLIITIILYTYLGYAGLLCLLSIFRQKKHYADNDFLPTVDLLITAYNEQDNIEKKIKNSLMLDYPKDKLIITVLSDGSTDKTDEIVKKYNSKKIKLLRVEGRKGKTICQNHGVKNSKAEIIIFSDSRSLFNKDAVRKIVRNFADRAIGSVAGKVIYENAEGDYKEGLYIKYEQKIRELESMLFGTAATAGAIYAVRKGEYVKLPGFAQSDFTEPLAILKKHKKRPYFEKEAICLNSSAGSGQGELKRHERIITRYFFTKKLVKQVYNPFKFGLFSVGLLSHKSLRFYAPFLLAGVIIINATLLFDGVIWQIIFCSQIACYLAAFVGYILERKGKNIFPFSIPYHFVVLNAAALKAWYNYARGKNFVIWESKSN